MSEEQRRAFTGRTGSGELGRGGEKVLGREQGYLSGVFRSLQSSVQCTTLLHLYRKPAVKPVLETSFLGNLVDQTIVYSLCIYFIIRKIKNKIQTLDNTSGLSL